MEPEDEEFDYEAIWRWIVAAAEQHVEEWHRQAGWIEALYFNDIRSLDEWYATQRRASRAWEKHFLQELELATAINQGDIASYIERWHPGPTPNGSSVVFVTYDEYALIDASEDDPPAIWFYEECVGGTCQEGSHLEVSVSRWVAGPYRMGLRSRLGNWIRRLCRRG